MSHCCLDRVSQRVDIKKLSQIVVVLLMEIIVVPHAYGYSQSHAPFAPGKAPSWGKLQPCIELTSSPTGIEEGLRGDVHVHAVSDNPTAPILYMLDDELTREWDITVTNRNGELLSTPINLFSSVPPPTAFHGDFNQDGTVDFLVAGTNSGNGLASSISYTAFFLSADEHYSSVYFQGYDFSPDDVIRMKKDGPWYYIYCDLISSSGEKTRDGSGHNFWVYQLFRFEGARMVETTKVAPFPKWVWYTEKENHRETRKLSVEQKKRILDRERAERRNICVVTDWQPESSRNSQIYIDTPRHADTPSAYFSAPSIGSLLTYEE